MRVLNFGSVNIDHVYAVDHFVRPGETLHSMSYHQFAGGKGFNQSVALARAGAEVFHAGRIGADGAWLRERLEKEGVNTTFLRAAEGPTGHAIIQVNCEGENAIVLLGGANRQVSDEDAEGTLPHFGEGDWLLVQNEITSIPEIMRAAVGRGLKIAFNPAPMDAGVADYPLDLVSLFIVNEIEGGQLAGEEDAQAIVRVMREKFPAAAVALTLGAEGVLFADGEGAVRVGAEKVKAVDTTAAGDTFVGYLLAELTRGARPEAALKLACRAAAMCVTRPGAADSIPLRKEVESRG